MIALIAQLEEHRSSEPSVVGSNPAWGILNLNGGYMERRNFLKLLPLGILTMGATAKGEEPKKEELLQTDMVKVAGKDGIYYNVVVAPTSSSLVLMPKAEPLNLFKVN